MVSFKKLFLLAPLLISGIAAMPTPAERGDSVDIEKRILFQGKNANQVIENDFVVASEIRANHDQATIVDLSGCTGIFFYKDTTLILAAHMFCGSESIDAKKAAEMADVANSFTIGASKQKFVDAAVAAVEKYDSELKYNKDEQVIYSDKTLPAGTAVTLTGRTGSLAIVEGTGPRVSVQPTQNSPT